MKYIIRTIGGEGLIKNCGIFHKVPGEVEVAEVVAWWSARRESVARLTAAAAAGLRGAAAPPAPLSATRGRPPPAPCGRRRPIPRTTSNTILTMCLDRRRVALQARLPLWTRA